MSRSYYLQVIKDRDEDISKLKSEISALRDQLKSERECSDRNDRDNFDLLAEAGKEIEQLRAQVESSKKLIKASKAMKKDLLMRADIDVDGVSVVDVSSTIWRTFCDELLESEK